MDIKEALQIVLDLARQNVLEVEDHTNDTTLSAEQKRQEEAIAVVEDMAVNQFGDQ
jgi:hypothetical protein